jgi:YidC/Oxa1 family membrane protein insertase
LKKQLLIIGLIVLSIFVFAIPNVDISENSTNINLQTRIFDLTMDKEGHILDYSIVDFRTKEYKLIYSYAKDSFNLLDPETEEEIVPIDYKIAVSDNQEYIDMFFFFEGNGFKKYRFYNDPNFHYEVEFVDVKGLVTLPTISYRPGIRQMQSTMVSFIKEIPNTGENLEALVAVEAASQIDNQLRYTTEGRTLSQVYMGPLKRTFMSEVFQNEAYDRISALLDELGAFGFFSKIFYWFVYFLYWLNEITGNFGWAIIIFTVIIRLGLYPLYHKQQQSMIKMREIQPEVDKLKKKYKNAQKLQEETMKLYKEKNVNPMGGCLPTLIQLPVFIVLWQTIQYFGEAFAYNPRFLFWSDLSQGGFGTNFIFILISLGAYMAIALLSAQNSKMAWQQIAMSTIFPLLLSSLPAGVFLYYTSNALIQLLITLYNNKRYGIKGIGIRELFGLGPKPVRR